MSDWYMTGTTRCRTMRNAMENIGNRGKPAIVRKVDGFYDVTRLSKKPVQPGQFPFVIKPDDTIFNH